MAYYWWNSVFGKVVNVKCHWKKSRQWYLEKNRIYFHNSFRHRSADGLLESTSLVMSPVDILSPDFERFPNFKDAKPMNCSVGPSETLFLPSYWWHEVQSYPDHSEPVNIAVNFWYEPFFSKEFPCQTCSLSVNPFYFDILWHDFHRIFL